MSREASGVLTQRNPTALFGAGLIDAIPVSVIETAAQAKHPNFPEIKGHVSQLEQGQIGRFGWKAQTPNLEDFVLNACALELGLDVLGHPQAGLPHKPSYRAAKADMTRDECAALVAFVRSLPAPARRLPERPASRATIAVGEKLFATVGCAACHRPTLGAVHGIYSDLLLHDLGPSLADTGRYGAFVPSESESESPGQRGPLADGKGPVGKPVIGARQQEWRTPPLWGVRDAGPYLHDGRAETLEEAIIDHGGEAEQTVIRFVKLSKQEQGQVIAFLKSLTAPEPMGMAAKALTATVASKVAPQPGQNVRLTEQQ